MTVISGFLLTAPIAFCIYATWPSLDSSDHKLRLWSIFRISIFLIQIPLRYYVWNKLNIIYQYQSRYYNNNSNEYLMTMIDINNNGTAANNYSTDHLSLQLQQILDTFAWKFTQFCSGLVTAWVLFTIPFTVAFHQPSHQQSIYHSSFSHKSLSSVSSFFCFEGYLSPCLFRLCWLSFIIFILHIICIVCWLRRVMRNYYKDIGILRMRQKIDDISCTASVTGNFINTAKSLLLYSSAKPVVDYVYSGDQCSICLLQYKFNDELRIFCKCKHSFHKQCIDKWLKYKLTCPLCCAQLFNQHPSIVESEDDVINDEMDDDVGNGGECEQTLQDYGDDDGRDVGVRDGSEYGGSFSVDDRYGNGQVRSHPHFQLRHRTKMSSAMIISPANNGGLFLYPT